MIHIVVFLCSDSHIAPPKKYTASAYQRQSIYRLIGGTNPQWRWDDPVILKLFCVTLIEQQTRRIGENGDFYDDILPFQNEEDPGNICGWIGVLCVDGVIESINWSPDFGERVVLPYLNPQWIPATVKRFRLTNVIDRSMACFSTRHLPKRIQRVVMTSCRLYGNLNLRELPVTIEELYVQKNCLQGTVDLRFIPPTMKTLNALENSFEEVIADNCNIPFELRRPYVGRSILQTNVVEKDLVVHKMSDGKYLDERIWIEVYKNGKKTRLYN
mmetsp:Transcript_11537/g.17466  ORF Transcript_11537/g.17466 Transcript_11537/m.17466 type:complete len:271 (-) Transcript_11537:27-839(-)